MLSSIAGLAESPQVTSTPCQLPHSGNAMITVTSNLAANPAAGTTVEFSLSTSSDQKPAQALTGYTTAVDASPTWSDAVAAAPIAGSSPGTVSVVFSASATGALAADATITLTSKPSIYVADGAAAVLLGSKVSNCKADNGSHGSAVVSGSTLTLTLKSAGSACALPSSSTGRITIFSNLAANPTVAGTIVRFSLSTSADTTPTTGQAR